MKDIQQRILEDATEHVAHIEAGTETEATPDLDRLASQVGVPDEVLVLWNARGLIARVFFWALVVSTVLAFAIPARYESSVRIMPPDQQSASATMLAALVGRTGAGALAPFAGDLLGMKNTGALFVDLLRSRTVEDRLVDRFDLQRVYWRRYRETARLKLESRTEIKEDRKSGIITVVVTDGSRQRARDMAQAYVEELNRLVSQVSTSAARRERIFIEQRLAGVKQDLEIAEREFSQFASKNTAIDVKEQAKAMVESAAQLQAQFIAAQSELEALQQIYTSNNVRVRAAQARISELRKQLENIRGSDASPLAPADAPLEAATSSELYPSIRKLPLLGVAWADLYRRVRVQETLFELLTQQYELARIQESKEIPTIKVIDPANLPERKSFPPRLLIIVSLCTVSAIAASVWLIAAERWNKVDPRSSHKIFAGEVFSRMRRRVRRFGARLRGRGGRNPL